MKNSKFLSLLFVLAASMLLVNCTTDPIPGPQGEDGIDGIDGVDGADGTASCTECHSLSHREPINASYLFSGHAEGGAVGYAGKIGSCAKCHSNEGHIDYMEYGMANAEGYSDPTAISCNTCHNKPPYVSRLTHSRAPRMCSRTSLSGLQIEYDLVTK